MQKLTPKVVELLEKAEQGNGLEFDEMEYLYGLDPTSRDAWLVRWVAHQMSLEATNGKAEIHAQIGLNGSPCGKNCKFCSFAVCNGLTKEKMELDVEDVKAYCDAYMEEGANLILMLTTASYKFEKILEMGQVAREIIGKDMPLLVNTADMTLEQTKQIKAAGFNGAYHAIRMREGEDTEIPVEERLNTIKNLQAAGLSISTCVEPVGPEASAHEIAEASALCMSYPNNSAGVGRRITVPGTMVESRGQISDLVASLYVAVYGLTTGFKPALNCSVCSPLSAVSGGNLTWAEVGSNPRDAVERTENGGRGASIERCRSEYEKAGWEVLEGPSQGWILD
jgi:biotin synthase